MSRSNIQASLLSDVSNFIKTISDVLFRGIDKLLEYGLDVDDVKKTEEGGLVFRAATKDGKSVEAVCTPVPNKAGKFNITVKGGNGKTFETKGVLESDLDYILLDAWTNIYGDIQKPSTTAANRLCVTLQRVSAGTEDTINLTAVCANYSPTAASDDLSTIVADDEFVSMITDTPTSFEIVDDGDGFEVNPISEVDTSNMYIELMKVAHCLLADLQCICWNAKGHQFDILQNHLSNCFYTINYQLDRLASWCVEQNGYAPHPTEIMADSGHIDPTSYKNGFDLTEGATIARNCIEEYISALEFYLCNFSSDIQFEAAGWIREWKSTSNGTLSKILRP